MLDIEWSTLLIIAIALISSSFLGALIQVAISKYVNRSQPIARRVDVFPKFEDPIGTVCKRTQITFSDGQKDYKYNDLQIVQIQLCNQGDQNFDEFKFGITLSNGDLAVYIEARSPDRHHQVEQLTKLNCAEPSSAIDFIVRPFNKTDTYSLRLLVLNGSANNEIGDIQFSSPQAIRFVHLPTTTEVVEKAARSAKLSVGPFSISLGG